MDATEVGSKSQAFLENAIWDTTTCRATYCDHTYSIAPACVVPNEPSPAYMRSFDDVICDFLREQGVPGASLYVSLNGRPFYQQGYGTSQAGEGVLSSSLMRIASISKVVTAMAVLKLCQERKLELTAQVFGNSGILSGFSACGGSLHITIEDLLRHSAGWDREQVGDHVFWYQEEGHAHLDPWDARQLVQYVLRRDLDFTPGSKHAYSNLGYLVLGMVIEAVSGMTYQEYVNAMLEVLDINDVIVGNTRQQVVHYEEVKYYNIDSKVQKSVFQDEGLVVPQYGSYPIETTRAYGGLVTCARSLVRILESLARVSCVPPILPPEVVQQMLAKPGYETDEFAWYGYGLSVEDCGKSYGHTGTMEGTSSTACHHGPSGLTWALLLNAWSKDMDLDGVVKYALSTVERLPLWHGVHVGRGLQVLSADMRQCVHILVPYRMIWSCVLQMKSDGFCIKNLNILTLKNDVKFNIIWDYCPTVIWDIKMDIPLENLEKEWEAINDKWKLVSLEVYAFNNDVMCVFVMKRNDSRSLNLLKQNIYAVDNVDAHLLKCDACLQLGYTQKSQSTLKYGDKTILACIFEQHGDKRMQKVTGRQCERWTRMDVQHFTANLQSIIEKKFRLVYIQFYGTGDNPEISAVWKKTSSMSNVFQRHDVSKYGFLYELKSTMRSNRELTFISAYENEGVVNFAAVWECCVRTNGGKRRKDFDTSL